MFVRGGVYKVVQEALGGTLAKFSVSALMFDYLLMGPISGVSAGLYLAGLINNIGDYLHQPWHVPAPYFAAGFALIATLYFGWQNTIGMHESSDKALRIMQITTFIMQITTFMMVILVSWCALTVYVRGFQPVPLPTKTVIRFGPDALGWLRGTVAPSLTLIAILIGWTTRF
jgi:Amino acid permease